LDVTVQAQILDLLKDMQREFGPEDLGVLRLAADRVALGIDHARVYEREHRIAETLQRSLLPERMPHLPGLAVAARYLPAAAEAEVGGDWYDVIPMPGGSIGLVMGDVAGKGLAAASMVGQLRSALRAYALEGHAPAQAIEQLNRLVWTELGESQMATLIYVVMDPAEGTLRWVNAGHLPPLLLVGERMPHFLEGGRSVPLGVMPFPKFDEVPIKTYLIVLAKMRRPSVTPSARTPRSFSSRTTSAASFATSAAVSTLMPTSAACRASASLTPSPRNPTARP